MLLPMGANGLIPYNVVGLKLGIASRCTFGHQCWTRADCTEYNSCS